MKYKVLSTNKFEVYASELKDFLVNDLNIETELIIKENDLEYAKEASAISAEIVSQNREGLFIVMIDETGGLGFASSSKVKGMITAQCSDEHSSHMTKEHNGSVGISLGAEISSIVAAKNIIKLFVNEDFAAGRHMVRIDMLDKMA